MVIDSAAAPRQPLRGVRVDLLGDGPTVSTWWDETELATLASELAGVPDSGLPALRIRDRDGNDVRSLGAGGLVLRFNKVFYYYGPPAIGSGLAMAYLEPAPEGSGLSFTPASPARTASLAGADPRALAEVVARALTILRQM